MNRGDAPAAPCRPDAVLTGNSGSLDARNTDPRYTSVVRAIILLAALMMAGGSAMASGQPPHLLAVLGAGAAYVVVTLLHAARVRTAQPGSTLVTVLDLLLITTIVWVTGGVSSEYYLLYYLPVIEAAVRRNPRDGIAASILGAVLYTFLTLWRTPQGTIVIVGYVRAATVCVSAATLVAFLTVLKREVDLAQSLRGALHDSLARIGAAYDVAHAANTGADFASVLLILLDHARDATGAETGSIALFEPDGELRAVPVTASGQPSGPSEVDHRCEAAHQAVAAKAPVMTIGDKPADPRRHPPVAVLYVPLTGPSGVIGVLGLVSKPGHRFSWPQVGFLGSLCSEAAIAIENAQLRAELSRMATTDYLTGLPNRREADRLADLEFARALRYDRPLTALMLDVDDLKAANDRSGHAAGDEVLCALGRVLRHETRSSDSTGRIGGDEFLVMLPEVTEAEGERLGRRLIESFAAELQAAGSLKQEARDLVGLSVGVAGRMPGQTKSDDLLALADAALYEAKRQGGNQVRRAAPVATHR